MEEENHLAAGEDDEIFVYMGGEQEVPEDVRRVRIDKSVKIIPQQAFDGRERLVHVEFHDGIEIIDEWAFNNCPLLSSIKLLGVEAIEEAAFAHCTGLADVEFGNKLETIGLGAFYMCTSLRSVTMPSVTNIGEWAFRNCTQLTNVEFGGGLEKVEQGAFYDCPSLGRIAMPLKENMIEDDVFLRCFELTTVDLVGGIQKNIASLHLESWRNGMRVKVDQINQILPSSRYGKTEQIQEWIRSLILRLEHYKTEHHALLKEAATLLELALWKAKIDEKKEECIKELRAKKAKIDVQSERRECRITSGASIVIKNVLPFLQLK